MKKRYAANLISAMIMLGAISGYIFHILFFETNDNLMHCIVTGTMFGFINSLFVLLCYKKYKSIKTSNKVLERQIRLDNLTELYNRYALEKDIDGINTDAVNSVIYVDIDNFSDFNNTYGHATGDKILKIVANIIKNSIRSVDIVYRYGGEEFVVILRDTTKSEAIIIGHRIVKNICNFDNSPYSNMTISAGVATMPEDAKAFDELLKASDTALLKAKNYGKNQLVSFDVKKCS